jgi:hypothetical protein
MAEIYIPFHDDMQQAIVDGKKTMTSRFRKYGEPGDSFLVRGHKYEITGVYRQELGLVATEDYRLEGFDGPNSFWIKWRQIHPKRCRPDDVVWSHEFKAVA